MKKPGIWIATIAIAIFCGTSTIGAQGAQKPAYLNPSLPAEQRAADLVQPHDASKKKPPSS